MVRRFLLLALLCVVPARAGSLNPAVQAVVDGVSEQRMAAIEQKLESFGTRNLMSAQDDPAQGIGAARRWIEREMKSYSPRLDVRQECHLEKKNLRVTRDVQLCNVVAELKGTVHPERYLIVSGHYDSIVLVFRPDHSIEVEATAAAPVAPGVTDDASGVAAVMELARVMSAHPYEKSILFVAFAGEEQGLLGSRYMADQARQRGTQIEAVLNNDIIGSETAGNGRKDDSSLRVFSDGPEDSGPRALARYAKEVAERYVPSMRLHLVFRADRFGRGGDHTPFAEDGFAAVRLTSTEENYAYQHTPDDTFAHTSPAYAARVARMNGAVLASLALAPRPPVVTRIGPGGRVIPTLLRGASGYDAQLQWAYDQPEGDLAGFAVMIRDSTSPVWQKQIDVGNVREYVLRDVSIDDIVLGVKAVDRNGNESLVSAYAITPYPLVQR